MKWILLILVLAPLGHSETTRSNTAGDSRDYSPQASSQVYYTQPANTQYQYEVSPSGYSGYNGYGNYPGYQQKQDSNNFGTNLFGFGDGTGGGEGDDALGAIGGTAGAIAAVVGLKVLKKLGAAAIFIFIFVIVPLLIVPVVLAIAAIIVSSVNNAGSQASDLLDKIRDKLDQKRALSIFENYFMNEQCIERMFCAIGRRAYQRNFIFTRAKEDLSDSTGNSTSEKPEPEEIKNPTLFARVSRAFRSDDCQAYKCSFTSYFY